MTRMKILPFYRMFYSVYSNPLTFPPDHLSFLLFVIQLLLCCAVRDVCTLTECFQGPYSPNTQLQIRYFCQLKRTGIFLISPWKVMLWVHIKSILQRCTHNVHFLGKIRKIFCGYPCYLELWTYFDSCTEKRFKISLKNISEESSLLKFVWLLLKLKKNEEHKSCLKLQEFCSIRTRHPTYFPSPPISHLFP